MMKSETRPDVDAREWWTQRETRVEREIANGLQKRMEAQRAQIHAFKLEQSKWEHELQLRISKYAHDRKLLSEHNIELQEQLTSMEHKFDKQQREMDTQASYILELEGLLRENHIETSQLRQLKTRNEELTEVVSKWDRFHRAEIDATIDDQRQKHEELINQLEHSLAIKSDENAALLRRVAALEEFSQRKAEHEAAAIQKRRGSGNELAEEDAYHMRVTELEKLCKQKDQTIHSLKAILERQELIFDEKLKLVNAKYDQVKTINTALQNRLLSSMTEGGNGNSS